MADEEQLIQMSGSGGARSYTRRVVDPQDHDDNEANAAHIANASPARTAAIVEYVASEKARADAAEAERNTFKAKDASKSKLLERFRDLLLNMCDHFEDEGDRVFFGSTNDPDELREIAQQMDAWKWDAIMGQTTSDPYADLREQRARAEKAEATIASLTEQLAEARERLSQIADMTRRCEHDGGYDREIGPIGCMLGDRCVCIGIHPVATLSRLEKQEGEA